MQAFFAILAALGPWVWFIAAAVLLALEMVVPGVHFLWFGLAAAVVGVLMLGLAALLSAVGGTGAAAGGALGWPVQVFAFALLSFATVFFVRRWARPENNASDLPDLNARAAQYIGRTFLVAESIKDGRGKISVGDTLWMAEGPDTATGVHVRVTGTRGTVLVVEKSG